MTPKRARPQHAPFTFGRFEWSLRLVARLQESPTRVRNVLYYSTCCGRYIYTSNTKLKLQKGRQGTYVYMLRKLQVSNRRPETCLSAASTENRHRVTRPRGSHSENRWHLFRRRMRVADLDSLRGVECEEVCFRLDDERSGTSHIQDVRCVPVRHGIDENLKYSTRSIVTACLAIQQHSRQAKTASSVGGSRLFSPLKCIRPCDIPCAMMSYLELRLMTRHVGKKIHSRVQTSRTTRKTVFATLSTGSRRKNDDKESARK